MWQLSDWQSLGVGGIYLAAGIVLLFIAKVVNDWFTPYKVDKELTAKDNPALGVAMAGYFAGVIIVLLGATVGPETADPANPAQWGYDLGVDFAYALVGVLVLNLTRLVVDKVVLRRLQVTKEIIEDRNVGTGAVEAGAYVAAALILAGAISGEGTWLTAVAFFAAGLAALLLLGFFHELITSYDAFGEIEKDNVAAGAALGFEMVALGIVLLKAVAGDFHGWVDNGIQFGIYAVGGFVILFVVRKLINVLFMPGTRLAKEIATDKNINAAWLEGTIDIGVASMVFFLL